MTNSTTLETLKALKLSAMAAELKNQLENPNAYSQLGFEERMALLVDAEWNRRQTNKLTRYIHGARFAIPGAAVEDIEYFEDRRLDKAQIQRFATCKYIEDGHHIILRGASGNGKTYLACALGNAACRKFKSVRYIRMPELLDELSVAKACGEFKKLVKKYSQVDLLILDEGSTATNRYTSIRSPLARSTRCIFVPLQSTSIVYPGLCVMRFVRFCALIYAL